MKEPRNIYEKTLWDLLQADGWELLKNGWPDILASKDGRVVAIEVKAKRGDLLKEDQLKCLTLLSRAEVECYRWDMDIGFVPHNEALPDVKALNKIKQTREERRLAHICPICGKGKGLRDLTCYYCQQSLDSSVQHQRQLLEEKMAHEKTELMRVKAKNLQERS